MKRHRSFALLITFQISVMISLIPDLVTLGDYTARPDPQDLPNRGSGLTLWVPWGVYVQLKPTSKVFNRLTRKHFQYKKSFSYR